VAERLLFLPPPMSLSPSLPGRKVQYMVL